MIRRTILINVIGLLLAGCGSLDSIPYSPARTPQQWLQMQPYASIELGSQQFILVQPSSTIFVYLLGLITLAVGINYLRIQGPHRSRRWWGIALILWGLGALAAGTSYQAFSYEIKCRGQVLCSWTSWWEMAYLILSAWSIDAMLVALAHAYDLGSHRKLMHAYAILHALGYALVVMIGAFSLSPFLISFELLLLASTPGVLFMFLLGLKRYLRHRGSMDLALLGVWLWLALTLLAYFLYLSLDVTHTLWQQGIWFSENDVLHLGLIAWMLYLGLYAAKRIEDRPAVSVEIQAD